LITTNAARHDYYQTQLPSDIMTLKSVDDECCTAIRYQLARYAYVFEEALIRDGYALDNDEGTGLRSLTEKIDYQTDTASMVKDFSGRARSIKKADIPFKEFPMVKSCIKMRNSDLCLNSILFCLLSPQLH
jgi:hypothetical protein